MRRSIFYGLTVIVESKIVEIVHPSFILDYISLYTAYTSSSYPLILTCIKDNVQSVIKGKETSLYFLYHIIILTHRNNSSFKSCR